MDIDAFIKEVLPTYPSNSVIAIGENYATDATHGIQFVALDNNGTIIASHNSSSLEWVDQDILGGWRDYGNKKRILYEWNVEGVIDHMKNNYFFIPGHDGTPYKQSEPCIFCGEKPNEEIHWCKHK